MKIIARNRLFGIEPAFSAANRLFFDLRPTVKFVFASKFCNGSTRAHPTDVGYGYQNTIEV